MKHYRDSHILKILNILSEIVLSMLVYVVSSWIRAHITGQFLKSYNVGYVKIFIPFALVMAAYFVLSYAIMGDYGTLHYRNFFSELRRVVTVNIVGAFLGGSIMFFAQKKQLSRGLIVIYACVSMVMQMSKRVICHRLAENYTLKNQGTYGVLIIGTDKPLIKYAKELQLGKEPRYEYTGYVANEEVSGLTKYLGSADDIESIISNNNISMVTISNTDIEGISIDALLKLCEDKGIEVRIIPSFSEYYDADSNVIKTREGTRLIALSRHKSTNILGVNIAVTNIDETVETVKENIDNWRGKYICVSNVHTTVMSYEDEDYCRIQNNAVLALPDGGPLSSYSRKTGSKKAERVTGPDFMRQMLIESKDTGYRHFFYGSKQETLDKLKEAIEQRYPGAVIAGMISPPYRELSEEEEAKYIEEINATKPDFVWVGLGAPKQEKWMARQEGKVNAIMIGVGAAFDYESGNIKRAPKWMQKCSLEWLYRLLQDPKRLFKRYIGTNIKYMWLTRK